MGCFRLMERERERGREGEREGGREKGSAAAKEHIDKRT